MKNFNYLGDRLVQLLRFKLTSFIKYNLSLSGKQAIRSNVASLVKSTLTKITTLKANSIAIGERLASNLTKN
ncbi:MULTISPECIES: hypothetical protein [unclassified Microcoleus]|uniref:hypothetical protein n=1 Tax=unclassified Microcoleus TaxID=2642155 RepID=UPI002FD44ACF